MEAKACEKQKQVPPRQGQKLRSKSTLQYTHSAMQPDFNIALINEQLGALKNVLNGEVYILLNTFCLIAVEKLTAKITI